MADQNRSDERRVSGEGAARQAWEAPMLEEIDYHDTASGAAAPIAFDGAGYSALPGAAAG